MDIKKSRELFVNNLINIIPAHIKPVDFLIDTLNISRVSAYRRLNSQLPFTYDEIVILSDRLDFSLDKILSKVHHEKDVFSLAKITKENFQSCFLKLLNDYYIDLKEQNQAVKRRGIHTINHVWLMYVIGYENLMKFYYYKWLHQLYFDAYPPEFADIHLSTEIISLSQNIQKEVQRYQDATFIIDKRLFFDIIENIQYYYRRNVFDEEVLLLMVNELKELIDYAASHVLKGKNAMGKSRKFYLSTISLHFNITYTEYDDKQKCFFYVNTINPLRSNDKIICHFIARWLESVKKYSVLMTGSNEALQMEFFHKQHRYLEDLIKDNDLVL